MRETLEECLTVTSEIHPVLGKDGIWTLEGLGADRYLETNGILWQIFRSPNTSYYVAKSSEECWDRMIRNESDFSNAFYSIQTVWPALRPILPIFVEKVEFLTGYNVTDGKWHVEKTTSVISNVLLLDPQVHLWALMIMATLFCFIIARVILFSVMRREIWAKLGKKGISPGFMIRREMSRVFYHSSSQFKWITFLLTMLVFYLITFFLCVYKTSHVIIVKPFYPENYQQSLDHDTSFAYYYDKFHAVSGGFRDAPPKSLKGKIWRKSWISEHRDSFNVTEMDPSQVFVILRMMAVDLVTSKSIFFAASITMPLLKSSSCSSSPEDQLYIFEQFSDPSESESIFGSPMGQVVQNQELVERTIRHVFEAHLLPYHMKVVFDSTDIVNSVMGTSKSHQWKQKVACSDADAFLPETQVKPISLSYFASFFAACGAVWLLAFIIHCFQIKSK